VELSAALPRLYAEGEIAATLGVPERALRTERESGRLRFYQVAGRAYYRVDHVSDWLSKVEGPCPEETPALISCGSQKEKATTSASQTKVDRSLEPPVKKIAQKLKKSSPRLFRQEGTPKVLLLPVSGGRET
jgi:hypothetical protein